MDSFKNKLYGMMIAMSFFTRIPLEKYFPYDEEKYKSGLSLFPLTGLIIGSLLTAVYWVASLLMGHGTAAAFITVTAYVLITGGIHLDGLADSADGLFSARDSDRILEIMKDSRTGANGVIALILQISAYFVLLSEIQEYGAGQISLAVLLFPVAGKAAGYAAASISKTARPGGMGEVFTSGAALSTSIIYYSAMYIVFACFYGFAAFVPIGLSLAAAMTARKISLDRIGGLTGDVLGMIIEISQTGYLLGLLVLN